MSSVRFKEFLNRKSEGNGKLILSSIHKWKMDIEKSETISFNIARSGAYDRYMGDGKALAPSWSLLNFALNNKKVEGWFKSYRRRYVLAMSVNNEAIDKLEEIENLLNQDKDVQLVCFCPLVGDGRLLECHRVIIGEWFNRKGYDIKWG